MIDRVKWVGTIFIVLAMMLTALNIYPLNLYVILVGSVLWVYVGIKWRDNSIILLNALGFVIYFMGIINSFL